MKSKANIKLPLTNFEKVNLKKNKVKIADILNHAYEELEVILNVPPERVKENICFGSVSNGSFNRDKICRRFGVFRLLFTERTKRQRWGKTDERIRTEKGLLDRSLC